MKNLTYVIAVLLMIPLLFVASNTVYAHDDLGDSTEHHMEDSNPMHTNDEAVKDPHATGCLVDSVIQCEGEGGHSQSLDEVVNDLLIGFEVKSIANLECSNIIDHDYEHVGESVMSYFHAKKADHEKLESSIGTSDSEDVQNMHVAMGKKYLGCGEGSLGAMMILDNDNDFIGMHSGRMGYMSHSVIGFSIFNVIFWFLHILVLCFTLFGIWSFVKVVMAKVKK